MKAATLGFPASPPNRLPIPVPMPDLVAASPGLSIEEVLRHLPDFPIATTRDRGWTGVTLDVHDSPAPYAGTAQARDHHVIGYCRSGWSRLIQRRAGKTHDGVVSAGMSILLPAGTDSAWDGDLAATARLRVPTALLDQASEEIGMAMPGRFELLNIFQTRDPIIEILAKVLMGELDRAPHPAQGLIAESASCALAAHLVREYNAYVSAPPPVLPSFDQRTLTRIEHYIDDHIGHSISLAQLAAIANVSRFHFARLFKRSTGQTAMAYVEGSRIRKAQELIKRAELPLSEIALVLGFADQSHFTRRFRRQVGHTPAAYARNFGARRLPQRVH